MTDQNTAFRDDNHVAADDDPLAELERIVSGGHEQRPAPKEVARHAVEGSSAMAGSAAEVDIEAELMRELGDEPVVAPEPESVPRSEPNAPIAPEPDELSLEEQLMAELYDEKPVAAPAEQPSAAVSAMPEEPQAVEVRERRPVTTPVAPREETPPAREPAAAASSEAALEAFSADLDFADELDFDLASEPEPVAQAYHGDDDLARVEAVAAGMAGDAEHARNDDGAEFGQSLEDFFDEGFSAALEPSAAMQEPGQAGAPQADFQQPPAAQPVSAAPPMEADFGDVFSAEVDQLMSASQEAASSHPQELPVPPHEPPVLDDLESGFADAFASELSAAAEPVMQADIGGAMDSQADEWRPDARDPGFSAHYEPNSLDEMEYGDEADVDQFGAKATSEQSAGSQRKGFRLAITSLVLALVAGSAVVGYTAWRDSSSGGNGGEPVIVPAEADPAKIRPEEPGGAQIANQDNQVYDRVAGNDAGEPSQESLLDSRQEPVAVSRTDPGSQTSSQAASNSFADTDSKDVNRLAPDADAGTGVGNQLGLSPKRVQTVTVKPDGTIVAAAPAAPAAQSLAADAADDAATSLQPVAVPQADQPLPIEPGVQSTGQIPVPVASPLPAPAAPVQRAPAPAQQASAEPVAVSPAPVRAAPAPQAAAQNDPGAPVQLAPAGGAPAAPAQTAAATPTVSSSEWKVQVSSQRTAEAAETSFRNLRNRFTSILGGRTAAIEPADIEGRGRFYRVKVLAQSQAEANELCNRLKSAGGSCLVTR